MEFFLPGLAALLIAALLVFLVLPRLGAPVLAVLSIVLLIYGIMSHVSIFYSEYRYSTWQEQLKFYAPFLMIGGVILMSLMYMGFLFGTQGSSALPASNLPAGTNTAVNSVANAANNAATSVANTVANVGNTIANTVGLGTNNTKNNKSKNGEGLLGNLGGILKTPNNRNGKNNIR
jgi:hypothetical protein